MNIFTWIFYDITGVINREKVTNQTGSVYNISGNYPAAAVRLHKNNMDIYVNSAALSPNGYKLLQFGVFYRFFGTNVL